MTCSGRRSRRWAHGHRERPAPPQLTSPPARTGKPSTQDGLRSGRDHRRALLPDACPSAAQRRAAPRSAPEDPTIGALIFAGSGRTRILRARSSPARCAESETILLTPALVNARCGALTRTTRCAPARWWAVLAQITGDRGPHVSRQWKPLGPIPFAALGDHAVAPIDVVQPEPGNLPGAQPQPGQHQHYRVVPPTGRPRRSQLASSRRSAVTIIFADPAARCGHTATTNAVTSAAVSPARSSPAGPARSARNERTAST